MVDEHRAQLNKVQNYFRQGLMRMYINTIERYVLIRLEKCRFTPKRERVSIAVHCADDCDAECSTSIRKVSPYVRYDIYAREKENMLRWRVYPAVVHCYDAVAPR